MEQSNGNGKLARGVTLAFALVIGGFTWNVAERFFGNNEKLTTTLDDRLAAMETKFLSKEVFQSEMSAQRREADMRQEEVMRRLDALERAGREAPR